MYFPITNIWIIGLCICALFVDSNATKRVKRIVGGFAAAPPPPDDPVVFVRLYSRNARIEGYRDRITGLYSFLGIRYAEPPIGENRFFRPQYKRLNGDINATQFGPPCPQPHPQNPQIIIGHEDCLLLNVFTPQMPDESTGLPVLVFIHGGGFRFGSANQYGPDAITSKNVIFVPIQYRLGTLGIIGDGSTEFSGNVALFDMTAAVRWVTEYIKFFGGDPNKINIIGHGSGAMSAMHLSTSRMSRDMITGVIAMSGTSFSKYTVDDLPSKSVKEVAEINNCSTTNETNILHCLQKKNVKDIISNDSKIQSRRLSGQDMIKSLSGMVGFSPVIEKALDNRGLPGILDEEPQSIIKSGNLKKIPLLTGVTKHETAHALQLNDIEILWSTANMFLETFSKLLQLDKLLSNTTKNKNKIIPGLENFNLAKFLKIPDSLNPQQILAKVTEATTDALFNLPAILTAQTWSKIAPSFMYSFEYFGNKTNNVGSKFLAGLPIVSKSSNWSKSEKIVSHGDELIYLFDLRDLHGNPIDDIKLNEIDAKVRDSFTNVIAKFVGYNESSVVKNGLFTTLTPTGSNFLKIDSKVTAETDFRYCQLSLWGASIESVKTTTCAFLLNQLTSLEKFATNISENLTNTLHENSKNIFSPSLMKITNVEEKKHRKTSRLGFF